LSAFSLEKAGSEVMKGRADVASSKSFFLVKVTVARRCAGHIFIGSKTDEAGIDCRLPKVEQPN
jgi:hypothetical protein